MDTLTRKLSTFTLRKKPSLAIVEETIGSQRANSATRESFISSSNYPLEPAATPPPPDSRLVPRIFFFPEGTAEHIPEVTHSQASITHSLDLAACKLPPATQANIQCFMVGSGRNIHLKVFSEVGPYEEDYQMLAQILGAFRERYLIFDMEHASCPTCVDILRAQAAEKKRWWFKRKVVNNSTWTGKKYKIRCNHDTSMEHFLRIFSRYQPLRDIKYIKLRVQSLADPDILASAVDTVMRNFTHFYKFKLEMPRRGIFAPGIEELTRTKLKAIVCRLDVQHTNMMCANSAGHTTYQQGWRKKKGRF